MGTFLKEHKPHIKIVAVELKDVSAARQLSRTIKGNIATVLPDRAERYFSTSLM